MRAFRRWLRNWLLQLPGGLGERVLVPGIRRVYERMPLLDWRMKRYAASEGRLVLSQLASGKSTCTIVYTGLSYGSLFWTLGIARLMIAKGCTTHFVLMGSLENRSLDPEAVADFYRESQPIARRLLCPESSHVSRKIPDICIGNSKFQGCEASSADIHHHLGKGFVQRHKRPSHSVNSRAVADGFSEGLT